MQQLAQLEGLVRLATARSRLLMKTQIDEEDAERAIYLIENMLHDVGVDVNTGKVDPGVLHGKPRSEMNKMQVFMDMIKILEGSPRQPVPEDALLDDLEKSGKFNRESARIFIEKMLAESVIFESRPGHYNTVN